MFTYILQRPTALSHGKYILIVSALTLSASLFMPKMALSPIVWAAGGASFFITYFFHNWLGFLGALGVSAFLPPLALPLIRLAFQGHPLKVMWSVWLTTDVLAFLQVLTAAYAFVPGAKIMREKTGL